MLARGNLVLLGNLAAVLSRVGGLSRVRDLLGSSSCCGSFLLGSVEVPEPGSGLETLRTEREIILQARIYID